MHKYLFRQLCDYTKDIAQKIKIHMKDLFQFTIPLKLKSNKKHQVHATGGSTARMKAIKNL